VTDNGAKPLSSDGASPTCPATNAECPYSEELVQLRSQVRILEREIRTDALTGLFNFRHFSETLEQEVERSNRNGSPLALIMVDLDHFKQVNDTWGHETGNRALQLAAAVLREDVRRIDAVCRYGGEEMALILPDTPLPRAIKVAERLRERIEEAGHTLDGLSLGLTASFGVGIFPSPGVSSAAALVEKTDALLYQAKAEGRNRVCHMPVLPASPASQVTLDEKKALLE